jgi:hypothetical protein
MPELKKEQKKQAGKIRRAAHRAETHQRTLRRYYGNRERLKKESRDYYWTHREEILEKERVKRSYNKTEHAARSRAYYRAHPESAFAAAALRRSLKYGSAVDANKIFVRQFYATSRRISGCLGVTFHVDHVRPLSKGGLHHENNLQVIPGKINLVKHARWTEKVLAPLA